MVATLELQVSADTFSASILSTLEGTPRCLPAITAGFQLQRVHYRAVSLRHNTESSFRVWWDPSPWDIGLPWDWITALQTQIAVDVTVDVATDAAIAAHPNKVVTPTFSLDATVIFNLDCQPGPTIGWLELQATFADVEIPAAAMLPGGLPAKPWIIDRLRELIPIPPQPLDMSDSLPPGKGFLNAGVTVDPSGTRLAIRAEQPMGGRGDVRWTNFLNGFIEDGLGANEWSIVVGSADLVLTLHTTVVNALNASLKSPDVELISVAVDYSAQPGHAIFTLTPYLRFLDIDTEAIPIRLDISLDPITGRLIVDVDAYGIRDLVGSVLGIVRVIINLLLPIVGWLVSAALHDVVSDAAHIASAAVPDLAKGQLAGAPDGTTLQEVPGQPFRYRASIPIATPPGVTGRITELITSADAVALAGVWNVLHFVEGSLVVDVSDFGWAAPKIPCGERGQATYDALKSDHPQIYAHLYSQIELSTTESAPVRLCDVSVISPLDPRLGVEVSWTSAQSPTVIEINAPGSAESALPDPLILEVRTSAGVFRAEVASPGPLTPEDLELIRSIVGIQLAFCDSIVTPPWFSGGEKFVLSWIVDPLVDPDPERQNTLIDVITLQVDGLVPGATLVLADAEGHELASALAGAGTSTMIRLARTPTSPAPSAWVRASASQSRMTALPRNAGVQVTRERLQITGQVHLSERVLEVVAAPALGAAQLLLRQTDECLQLDTSRAANPTIVAQWTLPGLRAVTATRAGLFAFGDGGSFLLDARRKACVERLAREPILLASGDGRYIAAAGHDRVDVLNAAGGLIARIPLSAQPAGVLMVGRQLLLSTEADTSVYEITDHDAEPRQCLEELHGLRLVRSGLDGAVYGVRADGGVAALAAGKNGWICIGEYTVEPWTAGAATTGRTVVHRGDGFFVTVLRRPSRAALIPVPSAGCPSAANPAGDAGMLPVLR